MSRITDKQRTKANRALQGVLKKTFFDGVPMESIKEALRSGGLAVLQEDRTEWVGFFIGDGAFETFDLGLEESKTEEGQYEVVGNSQLCLSWYHLDSRGGEVEVVGYVS